MPAAQKRLETFLNQINSTASPPARYLVNIPTSPCFFFFFFFFLHGTKNQDSGFKAPSEKRTRFVPLPASVNYVVKSLPSVAYTHADSPKLKVLSSLLSSCYLHTEIREKGGAYGGGATSGGDGTFAFYSYRDPNLLETLKVYEGSVGWVANQRSSPDADRLLEEAKVKIFSGLDQPVSPSGKGSGLFAKGITYEMKQRFRDGVFATSWANLRDVAHRYLEQPESHTSVAILGNEKEDPFGENKPEK